MCLNAGAMGRRDAGTETLIPITGAVFDVAHALRGEGFDASEDGTGRGTPLVPVAFPAELSGTQCASSKQLSPALSVSHTMAVAFDTTQITSAANYSTPQPGDPSHPLAAGAHPPAIAFSAKDYGNDAMNECSPTLRACGFTSSHQNGGVMPAVVFQSSQSGVRIGQVHATLDSNNGSRRHNGVIENWAVRRLTPRECERLQGFPDDWTQVPHRSKPAADGPRYKAIGNSMAVNCMRWIGERIAAVDPLTAQEVQAA